MCRKIANPVVAFPGQNWKHKLNSERSHEAKCGWCWNRSPADAVCSPSFFMQACIPPTRAPCCCFDISHDSRGVGVGVGVLRHMVGWDFGITISWLSFAVHHIKILVGKLLVCSVQYEQSIRVSDWILCETGVSAVECWVIAHCRPACETSGLSRSSELLINWRFWGFKTCVC